MLKFKEYLTEGGVPVVSTQREIKANLDDPNTIDELNRFLAQVTGAGFANPYSALQAVSKTLSTYGIVIPQVSYLPEPCGEEVFEVEQWGMHPGYAHNFNDTKQGMETNPGIVPYQNVRTAPEINREVLYVYFCYDMSEHGTYDTFCMVIDKEGLNTILATESVNEAKKNPFDQEDRGRPSYKDRFKPDHEKNNGTRPSIKPEEKKKKFFNPKSK